LNARGAPMKSGNFPARGKGSADNARNEVIGLNARARLNYVATSTISGIAGFRRDNKSYKLQRAGRDNFLSRALRLNVPCLLVLFSFRSEGRRAPRRNLRESLPVAKLSEETLLVRNRPTDTSRPDAKRERRGRDSRGIVSLVRS